jgi:hypothetical protein
MTNWLLGTLRRNAMTDKSTDFTADQARAILEDTWGYFTPERSAPEQLRRDAQQEPEFFEYANAA